MGGQRGRLAYAGWFVGKQLAAHIGAGLRWAMYVGVLSRLCRFGTSRLARHSGGYRRAALCLLSCGLSRRCLCSSPFVFGRRLLAASKLADVRACMAHVSGRVATKLLPFPSDLVLQVPPSAQKRWC